MKKRVEYTEETLSDYLGSLSTPLDKWGMSGVKSLADMVKEIREGESTLNGVVRRMRTVELDVVYGDKHLRESCIVSEDDGVCVIRRRHSEFGSVVEKLKRDENPRGGIERALAEEFGLQISSDYFVVPKPWVVHMGPSMSYPGIFSVNMQYRYRIFIPNHAYNPNGYFENTPGRTIYFDWIPRDMTEAQPLR